MAIQGTGRTTFTKVEDYSIVFLLNGVRCDILNFDTVRSMESASFEADFLNGTEPCTVTKAVIACYDGSGSVLGSPIEVSDTSAAVVDGGNLYLSKDCKSISCAAYLGGRKICGSTIAVVRDGGSVGVKSVAYKVINNVNANASLNWDSVAAATSYPAVKPDKGKYCYIMTIVSYTDGTTTNAVGTSYTPLDGNDGKSVTVSSTKVEYAGADSGSTAPATGWSSSVPQLAQGKYLWTRTTVGLSDGKSISSYSVGRIGMDGAKGGTTHILYASSDSPKSASEVVAAIDAAHQYYGTYQDTDINDDVNKFTSVKSWVMIKGEKGDTGQQGPQGEQGKKGSDATGYSLVHMNDTAGTVKATGSGSATVFKLHFKLHYKAVKAVGAVTSNVNIATIAAAIEGTTKTTTVNGIEGTLSGEGSVSYTSENRPSYVIPVTVTLADGTVLYDSVPVTMEAGVAVDINNNLNSLATTVADKASVSSLKQTSDEIKLGISSRKKYRNIIKGSDFSYIADNVLLYAGNGQTVEVSDTERYDTSRSVHIKVAEEGDYNGVYIRPVIVKTSTKHYVSVMAKGTGTLVIEIISIDGTRTRQGRLIATGFTLTDDWQILRAPFTTDGYDRIEVNFWMYVVGEAYIARPMLEEGSEYTGWTLSPEDPTTEDRLRDTGIDIRKGTIDLRAGNVNFLGADGKPYITAELDADGMPHLIFYNKAGTAMYDLGYTGLFSLIQDSDKQTWVEYSGQVIDGDIANCSSLTGGNYRLTDGDFAEAFILDRTIYEYHPAYVMSNGEKTYYNNDCKNQLYYTDTVDESSNNKPTGTALYTDNGILRLNGYFYELVERKVVSKKTNGGTTTIEEYFRFRAHAIYRNRLNLSGGMTDYTEGRTVKIEKYGTAIAGSVETKYKVSIDGSDYEDKDIVKL